MNSRQFDTQGSHFHFLNKLDCRSPKLVQCGLMYCVTSLRLLLMLNKKGKHALQCKNIIQIMFYHIIIPLKKETIIYTLSTSVQFISVQSLSHVQLFATPWIAARQAFLSITNSRSPPKLMSIESVMPSSHLILCRPLVLLPPIPPASGIESALFIRWPKYWSFSFSISTSNEHPGLTFFRMDRLDLLAVHKVIET